LPRPQPRIGRPQDITDDHDGIGARLNDFRRSLQRNAPMATIGLSVSRRTLRIKSIPTTGSALAFVNVENTGPTAT